MAALMIGLQPDGAGGGDGCGVEDLGVGIIGGEGDAGFGAFLQQEIIEGAVDVEPSFDIEVGTFGCRDVCQRVRCSPFSGVRGC